MTEDLVKAEAPTDPDEHQMTAERNFWRSVFIGMGIGAVVCAGLWVLIVVLAMVLADADIGPMLAVGIVTGVFAGIFLGGAMGTGAGVRHLEHAEHAARRPAA